MSFSGNTRTKDSAQWVYTLTGRKYDLLCIMLLRLYVCTWLCVYVYNMYMYGVFVFVCVFVCSQ